MENNLEPSYAVSTGIDYAVMLSFTAIDKSNLSPEVKRDLIYSSLCFRSVFDNKMLLTPDSIVTKYKVLTAPEPKKYELYELVYAIVTLSSASLELKTMWYLMFAYTVLMEAEHNQDVFPALVRTLHTDEIFESVLNCKYSRDIPCTPDEIKASDLPDRVLVWYLPYLNYKNTVLENGETREEASLKRKLNLGELEEVYSRTERLLDSYPYNEEFMLINLAARVALFKKDEKDNLLLMEDTLKVVDDYLTHKLKKENYFLYYRGLTLLGLMDIKGAKRQFEECLTLDPAFNLAKFMLRAIDDVVVKG